MSQHDRQAKNERSVKLCQLVYDRPIDNEIDLEIRKLLEEGVLIDFQDQSRNSKTVLLLAVEKCDVICVKFLLWFKPSLEVRDEHGRTPIELARLRGYQDIVNVLLNSTFDVVNESFIEVIDYESITRHKIEAIKLIPTFKVLKLINCPSVNEVWVKLSNHGFAATFNESSYLFFIVIETKETNIENDHEVMKKVLNLRRPIIVQLSSSDGQNTKIYFKDGKNDFEEIIETTQITKDELNQAVESEQNCNIKLLLSALRSNLFGYCTGNLLDTKLNTNESELANIFAKTSELSHRFIMLFEFDKSPQIDRIIAALSFKGDQSLLALLELPFELNEEKLKLNEYQQDVLVFVNFHGFNLLMIASELGNLDAVKLLLRCGCDFNHSDNDENRASDICWKMKAFDCLVELIEAGSPYPKNFSTNELDRSYESHKRIKKVTEVINWFHTKIEEGQTSQVKKFIASYPHIKHAYDTNNKCALTVALQSNKVDIYSLLMSEGFEPGVDEEGYRSACSKSKFKNLIRNSHRKYFKEAFDEPHLKRLLKMFRLSFGSKDRAKCSTIIRKMFDELNEINEIIPILKICSTSDKLRIVFDFNCDSVVDMDPSKDSNSLGAVYPIGGFVYIGAKNHKTEFCEVIGTLIHELTHYAMKLTYGNSCKPYEDDDIDDENRFEAIATETKKICDENPSTDSIVTTVFSCYTKRVWHQELIVRVPQLLATYKINSKAREAAERNTPELFHFYRENTLKDVEREGKVLLYKYLISKINRQTGIAGKIENMKVRFENVGDIDLKSSANVITSNAPQLTLAMLNQVYPSDSHIFVPLEQVAFGNILDKIAKLISHGNSTVLVVDCIGWTKKYPGSVQKLMEDIGNIKTIALVMTEAESSKVKENFAKVELKTFIHKWDELAESSKVHLLYQHVIFQGVEKKLNELVGPSSEAMRFFPLGELVDCKDFKVGNELHQISHSFYIDRKFIRKGQRQTANSKSFEELLAGKTKIDGMIISDEAGSGKSVTLFEIAKSLHKLYPDRWVLFIDLKRHIEAFKSIESFKKIKTFQDFIVDHILKNETKFDQELFKHMFREEKASVLFDGFDEISPNYKELIVFVLELFELKSDNQLYITTRPHLERDLEDALDKFVYKLEEFSEGSQINFLTEFWKSVSFDTRNQKDFKDLSKRLLDNFSKILASKLIGLPLLMRMTAEIFSDPTKENSLEAIESLSITSVFKEFVDKYFLRWTNNENEISRSETVAFIISGGILEIHHKIAIKHKFGDKFTVLEVDEGDAERIARVGLIRYDQTKKTFEFIHETFAEYFVADFICFHLKRKNRNHSHDFSLAAEILIEVMINGGVKVIQIFLEETLETMKFKLNEAFCESVGKCLTRVVKSKECFSFLGESLKGLNSENVLTFFLTIVKYVDDDVLLKILKLSDDKNTSALLSAANFENHNIVSALCDVIASRVDIPKEIFQQGNVLLAATKNEKRGILKILCKHLSDLKFTNDEIRIMFEQDSDGENILFFAAKSRNDMIFQELRNLLPIFLSNDEIKSLLQTVDAHNENFFHRALVVNKNENVKLQCDFVKSLIGTEDQKLFFRLPGMSGRNIFHYAAQNQNEKIFETLIESTCGVLEQDFKSMLMDKDQQGSNVLHIIAQSGNEIVLNELASLLRERLLPSEIGSLVVTPNSEGKNCFCIVASNSKMNHQIFCGTVGALLSG